ncbi:MAG TPA: hypothetical protein DC047_11640 [Blastocatellia bacterium]|nr:hypothetical protein [Blastocatellia bacterium]
MIPEILGTVGIIGVAITVAILIYRAGSGGAGEGITITLLPVGSNNSAAACAEACAQFKKRREERCSALFKEKGARAAMEAARTEYWATVGLLTAMITAAIAAGVGLPWPANLIVSLVFWTFATVLTGLTIYKLGKLNAASLAWSDAAFVVSFADQKVLEAQAIVTANCPPDTATACLSAPAPC